MAPSTPSGRCRGPAKPAALLAPIGRAGAGPQVCLFEPPAAEHLSEIRTPHPEPRGCEEGFTLAAVLVIMAIMAIFLTVAVETVSFQQQREKEEELIFRGNQIVEAIRLFRARNGRFPLTLKELVTAKPRVLRKTWTDPMTRAADWEPVFLGEEGTTVGPGIAPPVPTPPPGVGSPGREKTGPIVGVHSRSCADSIKVLDGRTRYCDWKFFFDPTHPTGVRPPVPVPTPPN